MRLDKRGDHGMHAEAGKSCRKTGTQVARGARGTLGVRAVGRFSLALLALASVAVQAAPIDAGASQVSATFRQLGVPVSGKFRQIQGDVDFDPARPAAARANIEIAVQSFDLGDKDYNAEVAKKDWFDAARHPKAAFSLKQVQGNGAQLRADGVLVVKGRSMPVQFPVSIKSVAGKTHLEGRLPVSRLAFSIGEGEWKDTSLVADEVMIEFRLVVAASMPPAAAPNPSRQTESPKDSGKESRK